MLPTKTRTLRNQGTLRKRNGYRRSVDQPAHLSSTSPCRLNAKKEHGTQNRVCVHTYCHAHIFRIYIYVLTNFGKHTFYEWIQYTLDSFIRSFWWSVVVFNCRHLYLNHQISGKGRSQRQIYEKTLPLPKWNDMLDQHLETTRQNLRLTLNIMESGNGASFVICETLLIMRSRKSWGCILTYTCILKSIWNLNLCYICMPFQHNSYFWIAELRPTSWDSVIHR